MGFKNIVIAAFGIATIILCLTAGSEASDRKFLDVGEYKVAYHEWGDPNDRAIMLLHGIPLNTNLWSKVGPKLAAAGYYAVAPGQLGLSHTQGPLNSDHSLLGQAELMTAFAKKKIDKPFILFGHDLGGGIAQIMLTHPALKDETDIRKVIIGNSAVLDMWPVPEANAAIAVAKKDDAPLFFTEERVKEIVKEFASSGMVKPDETLTPELLEDLYANYAKNERTRAHFIQYLRQMDNKWTLDASPKMVMWNKPAMLLWAIHDPFQPPHVSGVALARIMPHAMWKTLDASHFYPLEVPDDVVKAIVEFDNQ